MKNTVILLICLLFSAVVSAQTKYTIPVVVHIISPTATSLLTDQEVKDGIKNLNLQFQGLYGKTMKDKVITPHRNSMAGFDNIQFKLATRDVNNNVTTGITRTQNSTWSNEGIAQQANFKNQKQWNPRRYMNIYIVQRLNVSNQSGVAYRPSEVDSPATAYLDGVLIDDNIWPNTLPLKSPRWTDGFDGTFAHEVGHYLDLIHTMGDRNGSGPDCTDYYVVAGDGVDDTPKHYRDMFSISLNATEATRTVIDCDNLVVMIDNFMTYSRTQRIYTAGQVQRMKNALNSSTAGRNNLWTAANLTLTGLANDVTAPSAPATLTASNVTSNSLTLRWKKATDNQQVLGYDVYKDGVFLACTIDTTWAVSGLSTAATQFTVKARDFDGNLSGASPSFGFPTGVGATNTYCSAAGITESNTIEWIKNVSLNTLNNNSTGNNYYQDFSALSTTLNRGSSYTLSVSVNAIWNANNDHDYIVAWIDWNNDSTFADAEKIIVTPQFMTTTSASKTIQVPTTAVLGKIRMRVRSIWNGSNTLTSASPCGTGTYGEVEDYSLTIGTGGTPGPTYCSAAGITESNTIEWIKNVSLNTLNNNSTGNNYYQNFSALSTTLNRGSSYTLRVSVNAIWNANNDHDYIVTWIDWNNDGTFADAEKIIVTPQFMTTTSASKTIQVPTTAVLGNVRMRVRSIWNGSNTLTSASPCGTGTYGEVEDYTLTIAAAPTSSAVAITSVQKAGTDFKLMAYPNPTTGLIDLIADPHEDVRIYCLDMLGRVVLQKIITNGNLQLDLSTYPKGLYFIKVKETDKVLKIMLH